MALPGSLNVTEKIRTCTLFMDGLEEGHSGNWTCVVALGNGSSVKSPNIELVVEEPPLYQLTVNSQHRIIPTCQDQFSMLRPNKMAAKCLHEVYVGAQLTYDCSMRMMGSGSADSFGSQDPSFYQVEWRFRESTGKQSLPGL